MLSFGDFKGKFIGMPISHTWRGHGSAVFFELGILSSSTKANGEPGQPAGEVTIMLPWSWRVEKPRSILGGSWSTDRKIENILVALKGHSISAASLFGRIPELELSLSNGNRVLSFMTAEGQPEWAIICPALGSTLCVKRGKLALESLHT